MPCALYKETAALTWSSTEPLLMCMFWNKPQAPEVLFLTVVFQPDSRVMIAFQVDAETPVRDCIWLKTQLFKLLPVQLEVVEVELALDEAAWLVVEAALEAWLAAELVELADEAALVATLEVAAELAVELVAAELVADELAAEVAAELEAWLATDCEEALVALALVAVEAAELVAWLVADCGAALVAAEVVVVVEPLTSSLSPTKIKLTFANLLAFSMADTEVLCAKAISETVSPALTV